MLDDDKPCGVTAIGRCGTCRQAFCLTHQAHELNGWGHPGLCAPCLARGRREAEERAATERAARQDAYRLLRAEAAEQTPLLMAQLLATGLPGAVRRHRTEEGTPYFLKPQRRFRTVRVKPDALPPGNMAWMLPDLDTAGHPLVPTRMETGLTHDGQLVMMSGGSAKICTSAENEITLYELLRRALAGPDEH
ncbi:hypothetical protein V2S66_18460 [Streptomyces sp. V4-01]|uniref:AN1-type domain-containing protein n=1 Tax=Actinacidiphila polyblastidii TaxID=3110430 RepID=A0ABU7PDQ3_9ACTN|nr:hypothetical protein [Streptomyces sp. V4-01]